VQYYGLLEQIYNDHHLLTCFLCYLCYMPWPLWYNVRSCEQVSTQIVPCTLRSGHCRTLTEWIHGLKWNTLGLRGNCKCILCSWKPKCAWLQKEWLMNSASKKEIAGKILAGVLILSPLHPVHHVFLCVLVPFARIKPDQCQNGSSSSYTSRQQN
jgi:hypothetical protein